MTGQELADRLVAMGFTKLTTESTAWREPWCTLRHNKLIHLLGHINIDFVNNNVVWNIPGRGSAGPDQPHVERWRPDEVLTEVVATILEKG